MLLLSFPVCHNRRFMHLAQTAKVVRNEGGAKKRLGENELLGVRHTGQHAQGVVAAAVCCFNVSVEAVSHWQALLDRNEWRVAGVDFAFDVVHG